MSIIKEQSIEEISAEPTIGDVLSKLIGELAIIADDIEEMPVSDICALSKEEMIAYQKIDFSSQKLRDFSALLNHISKSNGLSELSVPNGIMEELRLEYTAALVATRTG